MSNIKKKKPIVLDKLMMEVLSFMCLIIKHVKGDCERHVVLLTRCTPELGNPRFVLTEFTRVLQVYRTK